MKKILKTIIRALVQNKITWFVIDLNYRVANRFKFEKDLIALEKERVDQEIKEKPLKRMFSDLSVLNGPFKGMKYPAFESYGSSLYPKLLGSYESELHPIIEGACKFGYDDIIDIGCAEGYYAVGLALKSVNAKIHAFDINREALLACKKMASINGVEDRINYGHFCSPETLKTFPFRASALIISDCEGYEITLFNTDNIDHLSNVDVLIEMHDGKNERISPYLFKLFEESHNLEIIQSVNCFNKESFFSELAALSEYEKLICLQERNGIQQWAFFKSKKI